MQSYVYPGGALLKLLSLERTGPSIDVVCKAQTQRTEARGTTKASSA